MERGLSIYVFAAHYHAKLPFVASACVRSAYLSPCRAFRAIELLTERVDVPCAPYYVEQLTVMHARVKVC